MGETIYILLIYNGRYYEYLMETHGHDDGYIAQILCLLLKSKGIPTCVGSTYFLRFVAPKPYESSISLGLKFKLSVWLVVSIPLKNINQLGLLFPIYGKIKIVPNHQPAVD